MEKKEHPAAKAGRYMRAAGIVIGREIDRRAAEAGAPAPPPEQKEHPAARAGRYVRAAGMVVGREVDRRGAAAAGPGPVPVAPLPPPAAVATAGLFGTAIFAVFVAALVSLAIVVLHAEDLLPGTSRTVARLVLGVVMLVEAALLTSNWRRANERVGQRLLTRVWGPRGAFNRRERFFARAVRDGLTLLGIAFLAAGVFAVLVAFFGVGD